MSNWNTILEWNNDLISTKQDKVEHGVLPHTVYPSRNPLFFKVILLV